MKQLASLSLLLLLGVALAACGGSDKSDGSSSPSLAPKAAEVLGAARAYYRTVLDGSARDMCSLMSVQGKADMSELGAGHGCVASLRELEAGVTRRREAEIQAVWRELNSTAVKVRVRGATATVKVPRERLTFEKEGGQWLLLSSLPTNWRELLVFSSSAESRELKKFLEREQDRPVKKVICPPNAPEQAGSRFDCVVEFRSGLRAVATTELTRSLQKRVIGLQGLPGEHWKEEFEPRQPKRS